MGKKLSVSGYDMWEKESLKNEDNPTPEYNLTEKKSSDAFMVIKNMKHLLMRWTVIQVYM